MKLDAAGIESRSSRRSWINRVAGGMLVDDSKKRDAIADRFCPVDQGFRRARDQRQRGAQLVIHVRDEILSHRLELSNAGEDRERRGSRVSGALGIAQRERVDLKNSGSSTNVEAQFVIEHLASVSSRATARHFMVRVASSTVRSAARRREPKNSRPRGLPARIRPVAPTTMMPSTIRSNSATVRSVCARNSARGARVLLAISRACRCSEARSFVRIPKRKPLRRSAKASQERFQGRSRVYQRN